MYSLFLRTQSSEGKFQSKVFSQCNDNAILQFTKQFWIRPYSGCKCYLKFLFSRQIYAKLFLYMSEFINLSASLTSVCIFIFNYFRLRKTRHPLPWSKKERKNVIQVMEQFSKFWLVETNHVTFRRGSVRIYPFIDVFLRVQGPNMLLWYYRKSAGQVF